MRVSTRSGSLRVTTTISFLALAMSRARCAATWAWQKVTTGFPAAGFLRSVQASLTLPPDTAPSVRRRLLLELSTRRPGQNKTFARVQAAALLCVLACVSGGRAHAAGELAPGSRSGLPVPRFVRLKPAPVKVPGGPTRVRDVAW